MPLHMLDIVALPVLVLYLLIVVLIKPELRTRAIVEAQQIFHHIGQLLSVMAEAAPRRRGMQNYNYSKEEGEPAVIVELAGTEHAIIPHEDKDTEQKWQKMKTLLGLLAGATVWILLLSFMLVVPVSCHNTLEARRKVRYWTSRRVPVQSYQTPLLPVLLEFAVPVCVIAILYSIALVFVFVEASVAVYKATPEIMAHLGPALTCGIKQLLPDQQKQTNLGETGSQDPSGDRDPESNDGSPYMVLVRSHPSWSSLVGVLLIGSMAFFISIGASLYGYPNLAEKVTESDIWLLVGVFACLLPILDSTLEYIWADLRKPQSGLESITPQRTNGSGIFPGNPAEEREVPRAEDDILSRWTAKAFYLHFAYVLGAKVVAFITKELFYSLPNATLLGMIAGVTHLSIANCVTKIQQAAEQEDQLEKLKEEAAAEHDEDYLLVENSGFHRSVTLWSREEAKTVALLLVHNLRAKVAALFTKEALHIVIKAILLGVFPVAIVFSIFSYAVEKYQAAKQDTQIGKMEEDAVVDDGEDYLLVEKSGFHQSVSP